MISLTDKVAVITGGSSGIGKGIAKHFHDEGAKVVIFGRNAQKLAQAKKEIGDNVLTVQGDVSKGEDLKQLYQTTQAHFGKVDCVVANAGGGQRLHVRDVTEEQFDWMTNMNYRGAFFTVKYALDVINPNASIILIASLAAHEEICSHSVYASNKMAVTRLAKSFASDLAPEGIRVNSISPGYIETPIFAERINKEPDYLKKRAQRIPLKRIGSVRDIANACAFLASDAASYITGTDLLIDGGYSIATRESD